MLLKQPSINDITAAVKDMSLSANDLAMLYIGEHANLDYPLLFEELNKLKVSFAGGIFPGIIYGDQRLDNSIVLKKQKVLKKPYLIRGLDANDFDVPEFGTISTEVYSDKKATTLILVDGLTSNISTLLFQLYNQLSNSVNYIGGGAGSLSLEQQPCVFTNSGFYQDAALVIFLEDEAQLGVQHGWEKLYGPIVATQSEKNIVKQLNWQNAFEVYKSVVEQDAQKQFNQDNFFDIAKGYPFGMYRENEEDVVRDPIVVNADGELVCVGEVPENSVLYILKGKNEKLIGAAEKAAAISLNDLNTTIKDTFIVDCISRVLFLQDSFEDELKVISKQVKNKADQIEIYGILSLGEISSQGGFLELFNKTTVVGTFY